MRCSAENLPASENVWFGDRNMNYLMDFSAMKQLEVNSYGTKKDILSTLFMNN